MADYKATVTTTTRWQRCYRMVISNMRAERPKLDCLEEQISVTDDKESSVTVPGCSVSFDPPALVPMRDPITGDLTGKTVTHEHLYAILYSVYRQAADLRDTTPPKDRPGK